MKIKIYENYLSEIEKELREYIKFKEEFKPINITVTEEDVERLKDFFDDFFDRVERDRIYCEAMLKTLGLDYEGEGEWYEYPW